VIPCPKYPIIAVTGSSGAGTSTVKEALQHIFKFVGARAADIEGDSFHRYDRAEMKAERKKAKKSGRNLSHFGPEGNLFDKQFEVFRQYGETGTGTRRHYIHNEEEAVLYGGPLGTFTDWKPLPENTDLLFYEGLHGGVVTKEYNMAKGKSTYSSGSARRSISSGYRRLIATWPKGDTNKMR